MGAEGLEDGRVRLAEHLVEWSRAFEREKSRLLAVAGSYLSQIEHVGSTAIPGLVAKPIIDICAAVESFEDAYGCVEPIVGLGYGYRGENGIARRHYFIKGQPRTHHLHILERRSRDWEITLLFRDHLIRNPRIARQYGELKRGLAARFGRDRGRYQAGKAAFIEAVLKAAQRGARTGARTVDRPYDE